MKRYLIFAYNDYYPYGGANDYYNAADELEEAIESANSALCSSHGYDEAHVLDLLKMSLIFKVYATGKKRVS